MWLDHADDKSKLNLLQEEEEEKEGVGPHLPLQSGQEEQIQMITLQPVSLVKAAGIGDALVGREKTSTGQTEPAHISFYRCEC